MNKKYIIVFGGCAIALGGIFTIPKFFNINSGQIENVNDFIDIPLNFENKSASDMRASYTEEGLEFIKKIFPDSISSDFALLNVGKQLTKELKDIKFTTADNKLVELKDLKGKKIILDFALTDCQTCQGEMATLSKYDFSKDDIVLLHIFPRHSTQEVKNAFKEAGGEFNSKHIVSSTGTHGFVFEDLNITNVPAKLFIDENGIVQYAFVGGIDDLEKLELHLERAFDENMPKMLDYLQ